MEDIGVSRSSWEPQLDLYTLASRVSLPIALPGSSPTHYGRRRNMRCLRAFLVEQIVTQDTTTTSRHTTSPSRLESAPANSRCSASCFYACAFLLPLSVSTSQFWFIPLTPHLVLFRQLYLGRLSPITYGSTKHPHRTYLIVYCLRSLLFVPASPQADVRSCPGQ